MQKAKQSLTLISDKQGDHHMTQSRSVGPHDPVRQLVLSCHAVIAADATTSWVEGRRGQRRDRVERDLQRRAGPCPRTGRASAGRPSRLRWLGRFVAPFDRRARVAQPRISARGVRSGSPPVAFTK